MKIASTLLLLLLSATIFGQNIKSEDVKYNYVKLPTNPLNPKPASYFSSIKASYEEENKKMLAKYESDKQQAEADYQREMNDLPAKTKAADDQYAKEMEAWNAKSTASKVLEKQLLNENNKPVKQYVAQPYRRFVPEPKLYTTYDGASLAATYLKIDGFNRVEGNGGVSYVVDMKGFEHTDAKIVSEVKKETKIANGVSTSTDVTYYHLEFSYRHPMTVRVSNANNQEIYFNSPAELMEFKTYKSTAAKTSPSMDISMLTKNMEAQILKDNLMLINHLVNDYIGFEVTERKSTLDYVKSRGEDHADLLAAFTAADLGLKMLGKTDDQAKQKIQEAITIWNEALKESEIENKKARIDKGVTVSIYFNLLECYFVTRNVVEADEILDELNKIDLPNRDKRQREAYTTLFMDLKMRMNANGL